MAETTLKLTELSPAFRLQKQVAALEAEIIQHETFDWRQEIAALEARNKALEHENALLRESDNGPRKTDEQALDRSPQKDTISIPRAQFEAAQLKFDKLQTELTATREQLSELAAQLAAPGPRLSAATSRDDQEEVRHHWHALRTAISELCRVAFRASVTSRIGALDARTETEFAQLTANGRDYLRGDLETHVFFQAALWRHLHHRFFDRPGRCWGEGVDAYLAALGRGIPGRDGTIWRAYTGGLLSANVPVSENVVGEHTEKIYNNVVRFVAGDGAGIKKQIDRIVRMAAELSAVFVRSGILPLVSDHPSDTGTFGFMFDPNLMEMRYSSGPGGRVGMVISPLLLKRDENDEFGVLEKADIVLGDLA